MGNALRFVHFLSAIRIFGSWIDRLRAVNHD
jgi:hypothetical protein